jgi:hypothetical protein
MNPHIPKWAPTLGVGVLIDSWILGSDCRGQNPLDGRVIYIIKKLLKLRCLKLGLHDPFGCLKHKLWLKERSGVNWQFDSWPLKIKNQPNFLACRWRATYLRKPLDKGYNFALDLISIRGLHTKLWGPKFRESQLWEFQDSHLGVPEQNAIWMWASWKGTKYTTRGKVVAFPKSRLWWILWVRVCPCFFLAPKVLQLCTTNLLFGFVQVCVSD